MKIIDLLESRPNKFVLMYHGTSNKFLKSILKNGLLPVGANLGYKNVKDPEPDKDSNSFDVLKTVKRTYGSEIPAYLSFQGGVYITPDYDIAEDAANSASTIHGGNPMVIEIIHLSTGGVIDEDNVFHSYIRNIISMYVKYYKEHKNISDDQLNKQVLADPAFITTFVDFAKNKIKNYSRFTRKSELIIKEFLIEVLKELMRIFQNPLHGYTPDVCEFECKEMFTLKIMEVPTVRELMNNFVDTLKNFMPDGPVRVTKPITFKGKTRIIRIFQPKYYRSKDWAETYYVDPGYNSSLSLIERD